MCANIIVPPDKVKVDPKRPETDPGYERALEAGKKALPKMTFKDRGEEADYWKAVKSNPANIPGLPIFYPPLGIAPSHGYGEGYSAQEMPCGHAWTRMRTEKHVEGIIFACRYGHEYTKHTIMGETEWSSLS